MTPPPDAARGAGQAIEQVSSRVVYDNPWMTFREDVIRRPDGSEGIYSYVEKPDFALIIPVDRDGFHLVEQYRYPVGHRSWEFPQGTLPNRADGEPAELARRELEGYQKVPILFNLPRRASHRNNDASRRMW
jgi:hypothetical protein